MDKEEREKIDEQVAEATELWRDVLKGYQDLIEKHKVFCTASSKFHLDFAGPGLSEAMQRMFHRRNFQMFIEDLIYEDHRKGGVSQLTPPKSSTEKSKGKSGKTVATFTKHRTPSTVE